MTRLVVTAAANNDVDKILGYLRRVAGARVAAGYGDRFSRTLDGLLRFPEAGSPRPALGSKARIAIVSPYLLIYEYERQDDALILLRILHSRRNITRD